MPELRQRTFVGEVVRLAEERREVPEAVKG
jgi:hypothetical protein